MAQVTKNFGDIVMKKEDRTSKHGKECVSEDRKASVSRRDLAGHAAGAVAAIAAGASMLSSEASAQSTFSPSGSPTATAGRSTSLSQAQVFEMARADVNASLTVGALTRQVASSAEHEWFFVWSHYVLIGPPNAIVREAELPADLKISSDMTLAEAMDAVQRSKHSASGLLVTSGGLKLAQ